jgi:hypothetical protein
MGIETGVDLEAVTAATHYLAAQLGITPAGKYAQSPGAAGSRR